MSQISTYQETSTDWVTLWTELNIMVNINICLTSQQVISIKLIFLRYEDNITFVSSTPSICSAKSFSSSAYSLLESRLSKLPTATTCH